MLGRIHFSRHDCVRIVTMDGCVLPTHFDINNCPFSNRQLVSFDIFDGQITNVIPEKSMDDIVAEERLLEASRQYLAITRGE